jgi:murein DD-endopeptidase MepM/ murein hydrolase activator NlpD
MVLGFTMPLTGTITSPFGVRTSPTAGATTKHEGIDIAAKVGTPVLAALDGTIKSAGFSKAQGNYISIDHGNGLESVYKHLSSGTMQVGQKVNQGQIVAKSGNTGITTGPHLEFQLLRNGVAIDPLSYTQQSASYLTAAAGLNTDGLLETLKKYWWIVAGGLVVAAILK